MQIYVFGKRGICFGYDKSSIDPHKSGRSNKQIHFTFQLLGGQFHSTNTGSPPFYSSHPRSSPVYMCTRPHPNNAMHESEL